MRFFKNLFGYKEATVNGQTFRKEDGYHITKKIVPGEGYRDNGQGSQIYTHDIPFEITTVTSENGVLVVQGEKRIGR